MFCTFDTQGTKAAPCVSLSPPSSQSSLACGIQQALSTSPHFTEKQRPETKSVAHIAQKWEQGPVYLGPRESTAHPLPFTRHPPSPFYPAHLTRPPPGPTSRSREFRWRAKLCTQVTNHTPVAARAAWVTHPRTWFQLGWPEQAFGGGEAARGGLVAVGGQAEGEQWGDSQGVGKETGP